MELVPIIVMVLQIVTVLAVVTLLTSYVVFKIRQKSKPASNTKLNEAQDLTPHFVEKGLNKLPESNKDVLPPIAKDEMQESVSSSKKIGNKKPTEVVMKPKKIIEPANRRIEVINKPSPQNNQRIIKEDKPISQNNGELNSIGEDILEKYVDENDQDFYTLKTNKKEKKQE